MRRDTSIAKLRQLEPAFDDAEMGLRYPQIAWSVTAGDSSQVTDGAAAVLIVEDGVAARLGLKPRAAISHFAVVADDPIMMLTAIIPATRKLLGRAGLSVGDIGAFEVNEAFASVALAWIKALDVDPSRVNRLGGAIALGHPVGGGGRKAARQSARGYGG